ncbi:MAG: hypothetical protein HY904_08800 [Deltaproteobacteria bacterium]|nr:hypothetical protein [Deltaproteobacteria bacterium]
MRTARQLTLLFLPLLCGVGCFQCSFSVGSMDGLVAPWEFRTQYAFWNEHYYESASSMNYTERSARRLLDTRDTENGVGLFILLFGFTFDYQRDFDTFTSEEVNHFERGMRTQPLMWAFVTHAEDLGPGDEVEFDSESTATPDVSKPRVSFYFSPGAGLTHPWSNYPEELGVWGSHVKGTLKIHVAPQPPLPGPVTGSIVYEISRADGEPSDVLEGDFTTLFTADVIKERMGLCNYYAYYLSQYSYYYGFQIPDGCASFASRNNP